MNCFAKNLLFCRKYFKITQESLANQIERSQTTIGGWENKVSEPNVDALVKLSEIFSISIDDLVKTDLAAVQVNDLPLLFKNQADVQETVQETVQEIRRKARIYPEFEHPLTLAMEDAPPDQWATFKVLQQMDKKLDELLILSKKKPLNGH